MIREIEGTPIGELLVDVDSIESVEWYYSENMHGSRITMKPVVSGFTGDDDRIYRTQTEHFVKESAEEITKLASGFVLANIV